jgi:Cdc6-like AAA superfamily ATPase
MLVKQVCNTTTFFNKLSADTFMELGEGNTKNMTTRNALQYLATIMKVDVKMRLVELQQVQKFETNFEQRDEVEKQVISIYEENKSAFEVNLNSAIYKQKICVGDALGGVGQGKTRTCHEVIRILREYEKNEDIKFFYFYWDCKNGFALVSNETVDVCIRF